MSLPRLALLLGLLGILAGCAQYRLGPPGHTTGSPQSVYVAPVVNDSATPQVRALLTSQLRRAFAQSPAWRLNDDPTGAAVLEVRLTDQRQSVGATRQEDTGRGLSFLTQLMAEATLTIPGEPPRTLSAITVDGVVFDRPGQPEGTYQTLPHLTQRLAEQILRQLSFQ